VVQGAFYNLGRGRIIPQLFMNVLMHYTGHTQISYVDLLQMTDVLNNETVDMQTHTNDYVSKIETPYMQPHLNKCVIVVKISSKELSTLHFSCHHLSQLT
jgi:hypothetical protein